MTIDPTFSEQPELLEPEPVVVPRSFGAAKAIAAFLLLSLAQFLASVAVIIGFTFLALFRGEDPAAAGFVEKLIADSTPVMLLASAAASTVVVFGVARFWAWHLVRDRGSDGIGWRPAPARTTLIWAVVGAALATAYMAICMWVLPPDPGMPLGPLAAAAASGGFNRIAWAILALVFAPLVEEVFFRGLLLRGFTASWGATAGAVVVTVLFVSMHIFETFSYWPATVSVLILSIAALVARRGTSSLFPAIALHGGYNLLIVTALYAFALSG